MSDFPFEVVAFDLDGTLADTALDLAAALNHALEQVGRPVVPVDQVRHLVGHGARALLRKGLALSGPADEALVERGFDHFIRFYGANICVGTRPYPGVVQALDALMCRGARLGLCTNKPERLTRLLLDSLGWQDRFDAIVGGDTLPVRKPAPEPLHAAIVGAGGGRAIFVGDSITDAQTAQAAALPFVVVSFGFSDRPVGKLDATAVIDHFDDLVSTLERIGRST